MGFPDFFEPAGLALAGFLTLYLGYEIWRWASGHRSGLTPGQLRRRGTTLALLVVDLLMWALADALMTGRPAREKLLYLLFATLLVLIVLLQAIREAAFVARQYVRQHGELIRSLAQNPDAHPEKPAEDAPSREG